MRAHMVWSTIVNQNIFILRQLINTTRELPQRHRELRGCTEKSSNLRTTREEVVMIRKLTSLLVLLSFLASSINAYAQQPETPEERQIKQYRAEIGELTSRLPPSEAQDAHAAALASL